MSSEATRATVVSNQLGEITTNLSQVATLLESQANVQADLAVNQTTAQEAQAQLSSNLASLVTVVGTVNTNLVQMSALLATLTATSNQTAVQAQIDTLTAAGAALMTAGDHRSRSLVRVRSYSSPRKI